MKQWYEQLFENYGNKYDSEPFTQGTVGECDFLEEELAHDKSKKILDIGCGTGRHSIEMTKRGYKVVAVDLSENMLEKARKKASDANLKIHFEQQDARNLSFKEEFDGAIMLCEGGFSLMETDEMNFAILQSAYNSIKPGGKFIFTCLNGLFPLFNSVKEFMEKEATDGQAQYGNHSFNLMTFRDHNTTSLTDDDGNEIKLECNERYYVPSEITWQLKSLGFKKIEIFGAKLGAFSREDKLTTNDFEMLVVAEK
jgi:ubiquinone/menaquinone biosynthesis C-methylase UbiE